MSDDRNTQHIRTAWQTQSKEDDMVALDEIRKKAVKFRKKLQWRIWIEYVGVVVAVFVLGGLALHFGGTLYVLGCAMIIAGALFGVSYLRKHGSPLPAPEGATLAEYVAYHRAELTRQRDLWRSAPLWYVGPIIPGLVLFLAGAMENGMIDLERMALSTRFAVVGLSLAGALGWTFFAAHKLQRQLNVLDEVNTTNDA